MDDDMFPRHEPLSFDPSSFKVDEATSLSSSARFAAAPSALSPLSSTPTKSSSCSCEHEELLHEQQRAIVSLQQDVFALRHLLEGEMNQLRMEIQRDLAALEARLLQSCKPTCDAVTASTAAVLSPSPPSAAPVDAAAAAPPRPSSASAASARHPVVWAGDFLDSHCGDDFAPLHPSQLEEKDQQALLTRVMEEKELPTKHLPHLSTVSRDDPLKCISNPAGPSPTALSISSLTALINPAGLPLTESQLITLACRILADHGSVPVGKMGSLLHKAANDHTLPALLKERYGGLKKFLQAQSKYFILGEDHPYNPHVALIGQQQLPQCAQPATTGSSSGGGSNAAAHSAVFKDAEHGGNGAVHEQGRNSLSAPNSREAVSAGSVHDAYACSLVDSSLMDDPHDSFFSHPLAARKPVTHTEPTPSSINSARPFFPSSPAFTSLSSYSTRLQESLNGSAQPEFRHLELLLTSVVSLDCEMVGCGVDGSRSMLARCSIVSYHGAVLYDAFVQPSEVVCDYRTHVSGIRPGDLEAPKAIPFHQAQREVAELLQGRVVVAHSVVGDLQALGLSLPLHLLRDTAHFPLLCPDRPRSLRALVQERLGWLHFQAGEHDSVDDARAVMSLYRSVEEAWESLIKEEQAKEDREKQQQQLAAARVTAAIARQRAVVDQQQQQRRDSYQPYSSACHSLYPTPSSSHPNPAGPAGLRDASPLERREAGGLHYGDGRGAALNLHPLPSSHSSIHSALWGK